MRQSSKRRLRIARIVPALDFGGVETRIGLQSETYDRSRFDLHVITMHRDGRAGMRVRAAGVPVHTLGVHPSVRRPGTTLALARALLRLRPDLVHASASEGMFHAAIAARLARVPRIVLEEVGMPERGKAGRLVFGALYRTVDGVVSVSGALRDYLRETERLPEAKAWMIHNCAQPRYFEPVTRVWQRRGRFRFFTAGRLVPQKNLMMLLEAMRAVVDVEPEVELHIAGEGALRGDLEDQIRRLRLEEHVVLMGFRADVPELLDTCDAFVFPAGWGEGCSNALVEAMARATPLISSDAPGNPEVAGELGAEWLVGPDDRPGWTRAMLRLARASAEELRAHGERGRAIAEAGFSPSRYIADVEAMYENTIHDRPMEG